MELIIMGRVLNADAVKKKFDDCPGVYHNEIFSWLRGENFSFIGSKTKPGIIRERVLQKRRWSDSGTWRTQVINLINGKIIDPLNGQIVTKKGLSSSKGIGTGLFNQGLSMNLKMGIMYRNRKKIHEALEFLETGGTITSDKYMPLALSGSSMNKAYQKFQYWLKAGMFNVIYKNGIALYFLNKKGGAQNKDRKNLKFVGRKKVTINFKLGIQSTFDARKGLIISHGQEAVERATVKVNNG